LEADYPPPKRYTYWDAKMVALIIKNSAYKGEYIAHNRKEIKVPVNAHPTSLTGGTVKTVTRRVPRPYEEWIVVPVPAIVTAEQWELANKVLEKNAQMSRRNGKTTYLLTGLIRCATCGHAFSGNTRKYVTQQETRIGTSLYRCSVQNSSYAAIRERAGCDQSGVSSTVVDEAVWSVVYQVLLDPQILIAALEQEFAGERNNQTSQQIAFLENQINSLAAEDEKLYKAYLAEVFDENEYAGRRARVKEQRQKLQAELQQLNGSLLSPESFAERKREILMVCSNAASNGLAQNAPFEVRRNIIKTIVERIVLNVNEGWFELEGVIRGRYYLYHDGKPHLGYKSRKMKQARCQE
jgi:site-specific DNA recombinase